VSDSVPMEESRDELSDPIDRASLEESIHTEEARRAVQRRSLAEMPPPAADGLCVDDCGEAVEPGRLRLGLGRCLGCARDREQRETHRRRTMS
jgi:RNA polymerase-binding transcription factor DksA